jgi:hypothetical protein
MVAGAKGLLGTRLVKFDQPRSGLRHARSMSASSGAGKPAPRLDEAPYRTSINKLE